MPKTKILTPEIQEARRSAAVDRAARARRTLQTVAAERELLSVRERNAQRRLEIAEQEIENLTDDTGD